MDCTPPRSRSSRFRSSPVAVRQRNVEEIGRLMEDLKVLIWSDLHEEFESFRLPDVPPPEGVAAILVAGDIWTEGRAVEVLERAAEWARVPVIFTPGNHDYYHSSIFGADARMELDADERDLDIRFLNPGVTTVGCCRIVAATLWTDYRLRRPGGDNWLERDACEWAMNDHERVDWEDECGSPRRLHAEDLASLHLRHLEFIAQVLSRPHDGPSAVMTHHAPSEMSLRHRWRDRLVDHAYASNLEELILDRAPAVWIHGHTHHSEDYVIGDTRIWSNPRGYRGENAGFDPLKVYRIPVSATPTGLARI